MDRNNSFFLSKENSIELSNISTYKIKIRLNQNKEGEIIITNLSDPQELAYNFCHKNNLDYHSLQSITKKIKLIQETNLSKSKYIFKSISSKNNNNKRQKIKNMALTDQAIYYNPKLESENYLKGFLNKEVSLNDLTIKEFNTFDSNSKSIQNLSNINFKKNLEISKKNSENINQSKFSLSNSKYNINDITNYNNRNQKNLILTTNVINQTIQNCLEIVEKDTKPFYNESNSEININNNDNIKENKINSNIKDIIKDNIDIINNEKDLCDVGRDISENITKNDDNKFDLGEIEIEKEKYNKNEIGSENIFENELQTIGQDIDTSISKSESGNLTKNIILNNTNTNTIPFNSNEKYFNNNLAISESININIPSSINKEVNISVLSSPKIPFHNNYKTEEKFKKIISKSNRCIPKSRHTLKSTIYNKSDSNNSKNKDLHGLFNESSNKMRNTLNNKKIRPSSIYYNLQKKLINNKENICTPSTYIRSCKNSLSSLTVSDKNLLLSIKENSKNNILNRINKENLLREFYNNSNLNNFTIVNNNLFSPSINSQRLANSLNINENTINKSDNNKCDKFTNFKEKNDKCINLFEKINQSNNNNNYNDINHYYFKTHDIKSHKEKKIQQKRLLFDNINNFDIISETPSIAASIHNKYKQNIFFNYNPLMKKNIYKKNSNNSALFTHKFFISNLIKSSPAFPHTTMAKNQKFVELRILTDNIISKRDIENSFKKIFIYITKNNDYLDAFWTLNGKYIPSEIFKPVQTIIKNCNKKRFISGNEFIRKGYQLFNFFSSNDKIAIMNFNIFS